MSELRYCLQNASPTQYQIKRLLKQRGWRATRLASLAHFSDKHLEFDEKISQCLEFKHQLACLVDALSPPVMPATWIIDDANWPSVIAQLPKNRVQAWILKPALLNNGQHIHIFTDVEEIEHHYSQPKRLGGSHVLQAYINNPHLLRDGRKYSIRLFMVVTGEGKAYLYKKGYFNVANHPYTPNQFQDLRPHLTNEHLYSDATNVIQIPSERFSHFPDIYQQCLSIGSRLTEALNQQFQTVFSKKQSRLALLGIDFMVDIHGQVWLLECNHGACFPIDDEHPLQKHLYQTFWQKIVDNFVLPIAEGNSDAVMDPDFDTLI